MSDRPQPQAPPGRALRLVLEYEGRNFTVAQRHEVTMAVPPSDPIQGYEGQSGFWYELRDANGKVLYRRVIGKPLGAGVEVHDPETGSRWYDVKESSGVIVALVPDLPNAESLVLVSSPLDPQKSAAPAEPVATIRLSEQRRGR